MLERIGLPFACIAKGRRALRREVRAMHVCIGPVFEPNTACLLLIVCSIGVGAKPITQAMEAAKTTAEITEAAILISN